MNSSQEKNLTIHCGASRMIVRFFLSFRDSLSGEDHVVRVCLGMDLLAKKSGR